MRIWTRTKTSTPTSAYQVGIYESQLVASNIKRRMSLPAVMASDKQIENDAEMYDGEKEGGDLRNEASHDVRLFCIFFYLVKS